MDAEVCEQFTDVYWIKFRLVSNARFAKRKLDEFVFLGNRLQVSYAPHFESLSDTKDKLEGRRREVLARLNRKIIAYHWMFLPSSPELPTNSIKVVVQLDGGARVNSGIGSTIGCGNSFGKDYWVSSMSD
ncbi:RNA-binding protein 48-like [Trifolium medium]|uniref:RNA-binding protein 48-like n=1 Tax=Trifolium medium TaxID=97028 RepID=A0A392M7G4_9FABA|nr:RNA-binding protein 48-like [Trifolium medium]